MRCQLHRIRTYWNSPAILLNGVENDVSSKPPNLSSASCDFDLWLVLHPRYCGTTGIYRNVPAKFG